MLANKKDLFNVQFDLIDKLRIDHPNVEFGFEFDRKAGLEYYKGIVFHIIENYFRWKRDVNFFSISVE